MLGLYVSAAIALVAVGLGSLDQVATVVTMFFLTTYGALNVVACLESLIGDPSFRPRIQIPWWVAALGGLGCFAAMFAISPVASISAVAIEVGLFAVLSRRSLKSTFGDARGGLLLSMARSIAMRLRDVRVDPRVGPERVDARGSGGRRRVRAPSEGNPIFLSHPMGLRRVARQGRARFRGEVRG